MDHESRPIERFELRLGAGGGAGRGRSGRLFIVGFVVGVLTLWGTLWLVFRDWRARHQALADYGARAAAAPVGRLKDRIPPGVNAETWRGAVADTRAMLERLTASGLLDRPAVDRLAITVHGRVARAEADPDRAVAEMTGLWNDVEARAGPWLTRRTQRPPFPPRRPRLFGGKADPDDVPEG